MRIRINKLKIRNFRNLNDLEINFSDGYNELVAENGKGKTNTLSSIMWCLFGKNIYDNKAFAISPIIDGVEKNDMTTNVTLILNNNYIVSRTYYQRKTTLQTGYLIDDKEELTNITQDKFKEELKEKFGLDEELFKTLSNINYIPNLNWKDLKNLIFELIGDIKEEEILLNGDFNLIEEQIRLMGINDTKSTLIASDKALNTEIKRLETEYQTLVNTKDKYVANGEENQKLVKEKLEIEKKIDDYTQKSIENETRRNKYQSQLNIINTLKNELARKQVAIDMNIKAISDYQKSYEFNSVNIETLREKEKNYLNGKIDIIKSRLNQLNEQSEKYSLELEEYKAKGRELQVKEIKVENETCSVCGQKLPKEIINSTLEKLKNKQLDELNTLQIKVDNLKTIIGSNAVEYEEKNRELEELEQQLKEVDNKQYQIESENEKQKEIRVAKEEKELETKKLEEEIKNQENQLKVEEMKLSEMELPEETKFDTYDLRRRFDEINQKLATTITLNKITEDIDKTSENLNNVKNQKETVRRKLEQVSKFNNLKADLIRNKAKGYFKITDFITKEYTLDGTEVETFKICDENGIEYKELNSGKQILIAIDLLASIQKLKNIYVPIICDNVERITNNINLEGIQMIVARTKRGIDKLEVRI